MDPKKKKLYTILGIATIVLSVGILVWSSMSGEVADDGLIVPVTNEGTNANASGMVPRVFPESKTFDTAVLQDPEYTKLRGYTPLDIANQLGRPDPFNRY